MKVKTSGVWKTICGWAVALAIGFAGAMQAEAAVVVEVSEHPDFTQVQPRSVGDSIYLLVFFDQNIIDYEQNPTGDSNLKPAQLRLETYNGDRYADCLGVDANFPTALLFEYVVKPGDFTLDLDCKGFAFLRNGDRIVGDVDGPFTATTFSVPLAANVASLRSTSDIQIETFAFQVPPATTVAEGSTIDWVVTRGGTDADAAGLPAFNVTVTPASPVPNATAPELTYTPYPFSIPAGKASATLTLKGIKVGGPYAFTLHPDTYKVGATPFTDGDLSVAGVTVTAGPAPTFSINPPPSALNEGEPSAVGSHTCTVVLSKPAESSVSITLSNSDPSKLQIIGSGVVSFMAGESSKTFQVQALDGPASVTISGTASHTYTLETPAVVSTLNVAPILNNPPDPWVLHPGAEGFPVTFNWSGQDVAADMAAPLYVIISFGDGTDSGPVPGNIGSLNHTYNTPNTYGVTITLYDKDGGTATRTALLEVLPAVQVQLTEIVRGLPPGYKGLPGIGAGMIDDNDTLTARIPIPGAPANAWLIKYSPTAPSTIMVGTPTNITIVTAQGTNIYDSFFHVWQGEGFVSALATLPIANPTAMLALGGENRDISGVFSREYLPEDNYADIDQDQLPDLWEELYWPGTLAFETPGRMGNPDNDFLPRGANPTMDYPAESGVYAPDGTAFGNVFEVRGLDPALNAVDSELPPPPPDDWPLDEPRYAADNRDFYGTDPTLSDTDNDGMTDGWEYYFWMNAEIRGIEGESYDPVAIITGNPIDSATIAQDFHPLIAGDADTDTDGDGLSNIEEMLIGTNPIHWDTDGDYMCDGWEVLRGLNPVGADGGGNPDGDYMAALGWLPTYQRGDVPLLDSVHFNVYLAQNYDPRTGWGAGYIERDRATGYPQPNTTAMLNVDEYAIMLFWIEYGGAGAVVPDDWADYSTNPFACDTDGDGAPDGWEAYVFFDPSYAQNTPAWDVDLDGLLLAQEFSGQETEAAAGVNIPMLTVAGTNGVQSLVVDPAGTATPLANVNDRWWNKFWPTDPNNSDTDGDSLGDGVERGTAAEFTDPFQYDPVPLGYSINYIRGSRAGGGLNPTCVDTDMDFIPDFWEVQYRMGHVVTVNLATGVTTSMPGMDGTIFDSKSGPTQLRGQVEKYDYDGDGLSNYQEYWANAVWHFNYDKWAAGQGPGAYDPALLFTGQPNHWDWAIAANYWQPAVGEGLPPPFHIPYRFIQPEPRPFILLYASTDPSLWDSDGDGMDDHYEMFHGLNPLWSETVDIISKFPPARVPDIRIQPWTAGEGLADPDQDGIPNWEEALFPGRPEPANYHTDPSPLWVTDLSYPESWANLYYWSGSNPWYWPTNAIGSPVFPYPAIIPLNGAPPSYVFSFESDEGYDSDNDNIPDKQELVATDQPGSTDPLDFDNPRRRKALYLDGASAVRTQYGSAHSLNQLRSWTVEIWVRPESPVSGQRQIIIERPVQLISTDPMPSPDLVRRTFRIGLEPGGYPFAEYNNSGNDLLTETVNAPAWILQANQWYHLSATMDGKNKRLTLYVNGTKAVEKPTALIPCTGIIDAFQPLVIAAPIVIGAGDSNPNGAVYGGAPAPALFSHFTGWVDEVRVWDGVRTWDQVIEAKMSRFGIEEVLTSMTNYAATAAAAIAQQPADIQYSVVTNDLPAVVLYHYTFDNLPDPNYDGIVPRSFDLLNGRPNDGSYPGIPWWWQANDRSRVYSDYLFVQWAENTAAHIPAVPQTDPFGNIIGYTFGIAFDSSFWTSNAPPGTFEFKNRTRASQTSYFTSDTSLTEELWQASDLLPLWFARADMSVPLWDNDTPGTASFDSDGDGLPDWWEIKYGLDPFDPTGRNGADFDVDGDGLSNFWEYRLGTDPTGASSIDPDGELNDGQWDSDGDGLTNLDEVLIYKTDPTLWDTDDDGLSDGYEIGTGTSPTNPYEPLNTGAAHFSGNGTMEIQTEEPMDNHNRWTVEAWIKPAGTNVSGIILRRAEAVPFKGIQSVDYELGLEANVPYLTFTFRQGTNAIVERITGYAAVGTNWVHLAGVLDDADNHLRLYVDAKRVAYKRPVTRPPVGVGGTRITTIGGGLWDGIVVDRGFVGQIDAVRVWDYPRTGLEIQLNRDTLLPEFTGIEPDSLRAPVRLFNFDTRGQFVHNSRYNADWIDAWRHAAVPHGDATIVDAAFPPASLDSDDDDISDVVERSNSTAEWRSDSPLVYRALDFDGQSNSVVEVDELVDSEQTGTYALQQWTVEAWVRPNAVPTNHASIIRRLAGTDRLVTFEIGLTNVTGQVRPYARFQREDSENAFVLLTGASAIPVGTNASWTHVAATYDTTDIDNLYEFSLYVDGRRVNMMRLSSVQPYIGDRGVLYLGGENFIGQLQEVRVWNKPRTPEEILEYSNRLLLLGGTGIDKSFQVDGSYLGRITSSIEDGLSFTNLLADQSTHKFAVMGWVKMDAGAAGGIVAERKSERAGPDGAQVWQVSHSLRVTDDGNPQIYWEGDVYLDLPETDNFPQWDWDIIELDRRDITSEVDIRDGQWHHLAAISDGRRVTLFIDGRQDRTDVQIFPDLPTPYGSPDILAIQYEQYKPHDSELRVGEGGLQAVVDEVMFWNVELSPDQIVRYMKYGLDAADVELGEATIVPLPEKAEDPGEPRQRLVSYLTFNGPQVLPFVRDSVGANDYRILPLPNGSELVGGQPPMQFNLQVVWDTMLRGYLAAVDGGAHVENYMRRNHYGHAGARFGNVRSITLAPQDLAHFLFDSNGDGIADWWYVLYGMPPGGASVAYEDWDGDGLNNLIEYQAGLNPLLNDTDGDGVSDYDEDSGDGWSYGTRYSDGDFVEDWWEALMDPTFASPARYDSHLDMDDDGWDNWSEVRYSAKTDNVGMARADEHLTAPVPDVFFTFRYAGAYNNGNLVVMSYARQSMNGQPDATFQFNPPLLSETTVSTNGATLGRLRQGKNWFFAFIDLNANLAWDTGEPAGLAEQFPYDVGWDMNEVAFTLTDRPVNGFNRLAWTAVPGKLDYNVLIRRVALSGTNFSYTTVYTKTVRGPRSWLHEGDILDPGAVGGGNPGLDWANTVLGAPIPSVSAYELRVDGVTVTSFTNNYASSTLPTPVAVSPLGGAVLTVPRPEFRWTMTTNASAFELQIMPTNSVTPLYSSGTLPAPPPRNSDGLRVWSPPIHLGDILPGGALTNAAFRWRVRALQPRDPTGTASAYSSYATFNVDLSDATTDRGSIDVNLVAMYMPTGAVIRVQAFEVAAFNDVPVVQKTLVGVTAFPRTVTLRGLKNQQPYYVCAYIDQDNDNARDIWESWGYYRSPALYSKWTFHPVTAIAAKAPQAPTVSITILHADTDQDKLPDSFEYAMSGGLGSMWLMYSGLLAGSSFDNPLYTDLDGDGLDDMQEYLVGTSAVSVDTDGDGIPDDQEVALGLSATSADRLLITGLGSDADAAALKWTWTTEARDDKSIGVFSRLAAEPMTTFSATVTHVLERTDSLQHPVWEVVAEVSTDQKTGAYDIGADMRTRPAGFYRIRAVLP